MPAEVFFYYAQDGRSDVREFLLGLSEKARDKCLAYINMLKDPGPPLTRNYVGHVRGRIWELRPEWGGTEFRFLYAALPESRFVILTGLKKDRRRLRETDIARAEARLTEITERMRD